MDKKERALKLVEILNEHNYKYYTLDKPEISDTEYDALYDELKNIEQETHFVLEDSPTQRVGGDILKGFKKHKHLSPLWSLDKAQSINEIETWANRANKLKIQYDQTSEEKTDLKYTLEYKFDGLTINLTYDEGRLISAATRGDGQTGEQVLQQIKTIKSIPLSIPYKNKIEVQGEGIMTLSSLEKYNKTADEPLKNARNAVAGAIRNLDPKVTAKRNLDAFFYNVGYIKGKTFDNHEQMVDFLKDNRIKTSPYLKEYTDINKIEEELNKVEKTRSNLDFLIDGMVIKIDSFKLREAFGNTQKFPRWAVAYKFEAEETTTVIEKIIWQVGRTGKLTPLAHIESVDIGGATIKRATLNNFGDIQRKNVKIGSKVLIRRSNDVIPEILGAISETQEGLKDVVKPTQCPACRKELIEKGANIFCVNSLFCKPQLVSRLSHFASRDAMNINKFSKKTAETLYEKMNISDISGLYSIDFKKLEELEGFKQKKVENLKAALEDSKTPALSNFIYALGINNVGKKTAKDLAKNFNTFENIKNVTFENLIIIRDIGEIVAESIVKFFKDENNLAVIYKLFELGVVPNEKTDNNESLPFEGMIFVLTGSLQNYKRSDAGKMIEDLGGSVSASVSKNTNYVVAGEKAGSKLKKANDLGVKVLKEQEFTDLINNY